MKKLTLLLFALISFLASNGQVRTGMTASNYGGVNRIHMNPAYTAGSPLAFDINFAGAGIGVSNNIFKLGLENGNLTTTNKDKNYLSTQVKVHGLAFMIATKEKGFGFFINSNIHLSAKNIPFGFAEKLGSGDLNQLMEDKVTIRNMRINAMQYNEIGFNYANHLFKTKYYRVKFGANLKLILSPVGGSFALKKFIYPGNKYDNYLKTLEESKVEIKYGVSNFNQISSIQSALTNGTGFGVDLGMTFENDRVYKARGKKHFDQYEWKLDLSLIDLGFVTYGKKNSTTHKISNSTQFANELKEDIDTSDLFTSYIERFSDDLFTYDNNGNLTILLPTTAVVHVDRNIHQRFYVGATLMQPLSLSLNSLQKYKLLNIAPRFESSFFEFGLPFTLYDYTKPHLGFYMRLAFLTFGSDRLITSGKAQVQGADFYLSLKAFVRRSHRPRSGPLSRMLIRMEKKTKRKRLHINSPKI